MKIILHLDQEMNASFRLLCAIACVSMSLVSCKPATMQTDGKTETSKPDPVEGLIFLSFVMRKDASGNAIELTDKTIVHQKLKADPPNSTAPNRIWINQMTESGTKLSSVALDHPLFKRVEFANDQGKFESREITLQDAAFFARVTLFAQTEYIRVDEELGGVITYSVTFNIHH